MSNYQILPNLKEIATQYDGVILDLWGVLHNGEKAFPDVPAALAHLKQANIRICLLSNAPFRKESVVEKMRNMGITPDLYDEIVTSGQATRDDLSAFNDPFFEGVGKKAYIIEPGKYDCLLEDLEGFEHVASIEEADFVIAAGFKDFSKKLSDCIPTLQKALERNLPMICSNPDLEVMVGENRVTCAGSFAKWYTEQGGKVRYHGKPHAGVYLNAMSKLGITDKSRILAFGDALHTDVAGADQAKIDVTLVATGIHQTELCDPTGHFPAQEQTTLLIEQSDVKPTYIMEKFAW